MYTARTIAAELTVSSRLGAADAKNAVDVASGVNFHVGPQSATSLFGSVAWAISTAAFIGLIANFSMHLVNLRMQGIGIPSSLISASVAFQALTICLTALAAKLINSRCGLRSTIPISSILCALALLGSFLSTDFYFISVSARNSIGKCSLKQSVT